ncbi:MAG TPA: MFS transporter [Armatimonadota bacterium]|nr:MFS transporter [Armatimonadota bacterium]
MGVFWLYFRLFIMMFLQFAIWGAWAPVLGQVLDKMGFSGTQIGWIFSLMPLACILSPFIGGQLADRYMPTQWFLSIASIIGGVAFLMAAQQSEFSAMSWFMFIGCFAFAPTIALSSSLAFQNLKQVDRDFGIIRVGGTIGWIVAGLLLTAWRNTRGDGAVGALPIDCLQLGGWAAIAMGVYCLTLPNTPPQREGTNPLAFMQALKMLRDPVFAIFMAISFVVTTELQFYYVLTSPFLANIGVPEARIPAYMTLAQFAEIFVMALALPLVLPRLGIRKTLAIGVIAWPIRYVIFAIGSPVWLVIASLTLHGFCYVFFFTVSQVYVDKVAPRDIRASAQSLLSLITLGIGSYLGSLFCGWVKDYFTTGSGKEAVTNWQMVFVIPIALTVACAIAFLLFFKEREAAEPEAAAA